MIIQTSLQLHFVFELYTDIYHHFQILSNLQLTPEHIAHFEGIMPGRVLSDDDDVSGYTQDWLGQ